VGPDQWHAPAEQAYARLQAEPTKFFTSTFILLETGNAAARRPYRGAAVRLRNALEGTGSLVMPTTDDWRLAWQAYERGEADNAGIVDHVSFVIMRRMRITLAFTNDRHFRAAGFQVLF
jgi:predicted nucleic acid-binding protein